MEPRVIKTDADYDEALREIEDLSALAPKPGTKEFDRLEVLATLVEAFEKTRFPIELPDPIAAIRFRMEQQNLTQADLVPYIGSRARVSEILSGKRTLSLAMIRALHEGLGIPAQVLIGASESVAADAPTPEWSSFPFKEMVRRGWLEISRTAKEDAAWSAIETYVREAFDLAATAPVFRRSLRERAQSRSDEPSLLAWTARVLKTASDIKTEPYAVGSIDDAYLTKIARLSASKNGPLLAREMLAFSGVVLVFVRQLPKTYVDGCSLLLKDGRPVIGMTIRHDRIDNFWFTLLHELAHVSRHLTKETPAFVDDLDSEAVSDPIETEADQLASEALIPRSIWRRSHAWRERTPQAVEALATELRIHPAIVAGRIRRETKRYTLLSHMVGQGEVASLLGLENQV